MQIKRFILLLTTLVLSACIFHDRSEDYQRSGSIGTIELPEGMSSAPLDPMYPIPEVSERYGSFHDVGQGGFVIPRPEPRNIEKDNAKVKIQRVGERRWILAEAPTSHVWPLVQSFLTNNGIDVARSVPATGVIHTDWVYFNADVGMKSQFRINIEKGVRSEATEVHILHHQVAEAATELGAWPDHSTNPEREEWFVDALANTLAEQIDTRGASLLGQAVGGKAKAERFAVGSEPALRLRLERQRAWATVAHSLKQDNFILWDEDATNGIFYIQHQDPERKRTRFMRRIFGERKELSETTPYSISEVKQHLAEAPEVRELFDGLSGVDFNAPLEDGIGYLVVVKKDDDGFVMKVRDHRGLRLDLPTSRRLIAIIHRNLI